jgi:hypothetical protein
MDEPVIYSPRLPDTNAVRALQRDPVFRYDTDPKGLSLWERFMAWLRSVFGVKRGSFADDFWTEYFWYILFAVIVGVLLYIFFKKEIRSFFYRNTSLRSPKLEVLAEDINTYDFDSAIREAESKGNYRYAVRLSYLKNLKALNERGLIEWSPDKTNAEYFSELAGKPMQRVFGQCTHIFNWIWYGDFPLSGTDYRDAALVFSHFHNQIRQQS